MTVIQQMWRMIQDQSSTVLTIAAVIAAILALTVVTAIVAATVHARRGGHSNVKKAIGGAAVQALATYATLLGLRAFWHKVMGLDDAEAWLLAAGFEAMIWYAVGTIVAYGGQPDTKGFGPAGPFFWFVAVNNTVLAVLGAFHDGWEVALGRIAIVAPGVYIWYLVLRRYTRRPELSVWHQLQIMLGRRPRPKTGAEITDREWSVTRIARAIRWSNGRWGRGWRTPVAVLGDRALTRHAESNAPHVIAEGRLRYAVGYVLRDQVAPHSEVMQATIEAVRAATTASLAQLADLVANPDQRETTAPAATPRLPAAVTPEQAAPVTPPALTPPPRQAARVDAPPAGDTPSGETTGRDPYVMYADVISAVQDQVRDWKTRERAFSGNEILKIAKDRGIALTGKPTGLKVRSLIESLADRDPVGAVNWLIRENVLTTEAAARIGATPDRDPTG